MPEQLRRLFSFPVFIGACLVLEAFGSTSYSDLAAGKVFAAGDTWWHLATGEQVLATRTWPTTDLYSFTVHGNPWIAYEWLGEVLMALALRLGGLRGLAVLLVILAASLTLLLYYYAWLCSGNVKAAAAACAVVVPLAGVFFTPRPQLLGFILLLITLICLEQFRRGGSRWLWLLPPVFLLWANVHGSFVMGLFALGLYGVCGLTSFQSGQVVAEAWTLRQRLRMLLTIFLCLLALLATPYGTRLATYPLELATQQPANLSFVTEWQPLSFSTSYGLWFLGFMLSVFLAQVLFPFVYRLEILAFFLFTILESCLHVRFLIFFVMALTPILAQLLARWIPPYEPPKDHPWVNAVLIGVVLAIVVAFMPSRRRLDEAVAEKYPVRAVEYLRRHPVPAAMFNEETWGGFLIWSLGPEHRVFIDGRADIYEYGGVLADCVRIESLEGDPLLLLQKYGIKACLLHRGVPLGTLLATSPDWQRVYEDKISTIFARKQQNEARQAWKLDEMK